MLHGISDTTSVITSFEYPQVVHGFSAPAGRYSSALMWCRGLHSLEPMKGLESFTL